MDNKHFQIPESCKVALKTRTQKSDGSREYQLHIISTHGPTVKKVNQALVTSTDGYLISSIGSNGYITLPKLPNEYHGKSYRSVVVKFGCKKGANPIFGNLFIEESHTISASEPCDNTKLADAADKLKAISLNNFQLKSKKVWYGTEILTFRPVTTEEFDLFNELKLRAKSTTEEHKKEAAKIRERIKKREDAELTRIAAHHKQRALISIKTEDEIIASAAAILKRRNAEKTKNANS